MNSDSTTTTTTTTTGALESMFYVCADTGCVLVLVSVFVGDGGVGLAGFFFFILFFWRRGGVHFSSFLNIVLLGLGLGFNGIGYTSLWFCN